jgi:hypothetical protein
LQIFHNILIDFGFILDEFIAISLHILTNSQRLQHHPLFTMDADPFDELLGLEEKFYDEGYKLGESEGATAGRIEGRVFGLEKGFEKYLEAGRLHGRSIVWAGRFPQGDITDKPAAAEGLQQEVQDSVDPATNRHISTLPPLSNNPRLEKHVRVLYALCEPVSLSTDNTEEAVSDFDDRLKRAHAKIKIIERLVGEDVPSGASDSLGHQVGGPSSADNNIEDVNILKARH